MNIDYKSVGMTALIAVLAVALVKASGMHKGLPVLKKL